MRLRRIRWRWHCVQLWELTFAWRALCAVADVEWADDGGWVVTWEAAA